MAVDGFFVVSGFLITQSFQSDPNLWRYLWKRVLRIYPAFVVAFAFCVFVVAPLAGATSVAPLQNIIRVLLLLGPKADGVFVGMPYPELNGAMWSIAYEFRCYLMVAVLGALGAFRWRAAIATTGVVCLLLTGFDLTPSLAVPYDTLGLFGVLPTDVRMGGVFLIGMSFYLYRDSYRLTGMGAAVAAVALVALLFVPQVAELAFAVLGGYLIFWFVFATRSLPLAKRTDISYGLYLYAWPVGSLLVYHLGRDPSPWLVMVLTTLLAGILGALSWFLIERPALALKKKSSRPTAIAST